MQNGQLRTSCRSKVIHQFWKQFVGNIDTAGFLQRVQFKSEVTNSPHEGGANHPQKPKPKMKRGMTISDNRLRDRPEWLENCIRFGTSYISDIYVYTHFPKDRNCEVCLQTKMTRASCRRRTGEAPPRAEKFGDLITADHKVLNEDVDLEKIRNRGTRFNHSMDTILSVCNDNFSGDGKEFTNISRAIGKAENHLYWQFVGIWRDYEFRESTARREPTVRSEDFSRELHDEPGESQPTESTDDAEVQAHFWSIQGDFLYRHHTEPRVQLYVPKEETFSIPLKCIEVVRSTQTDLDVLQEKRIDDCWFVESSKHLSDSWKGFTKFTPLKEKPRNRFLWSGRRLTKVQTTTRPYQVRTEVWTKIGKASRAESRKTGME